MRAVVGRILACMVIALALLGASVALAPEAYLQLDDVVVTVRPVPGVGPVLTSGIVTQVRARHEAATFGSDVFLTNEGVLVIAANQFRTQARNREDARVRLVALIREAAVPPKLATPHIVLAAEPPLISTAEPSAW